MPGPVDISTFAGAAAPGEYSPSALLTTRGDIIVVDSTGKPVRRALGAANTVFRSDGTDAAWGSVPGRPTVRNNGYYLLPPAVTNTNRSSFVATKDLTYAVPAWVPSACTVVEIGVEVATAGTSSLVRLGMFNNGTGAPGTVAAQNTVVTTTTGPVAATVAVSVAVAAAGWYWFAVVQNCTSGTAVATLRSIVAADAMPPAYPLAYTVQPTNANTAVNNFQPQGYSYTGFSNGVVFTDSPSAGEAVLTAQQLPMMWFKVTVP